MHLDNKTQLKLHMIRESTSLERLVFYLWIECPYSFKLRGCRERDRMVVGFTYAISAYHH